jgi:hypothetical protein
LDLVFVEMRVPESNDRWYVADAGLREGIKEWWLGEPPGGAFEYWWDKATNGYNTAVFHYYVRNEEVAVDLVERRKQELAAGMTSITVQPMPSEMEEALGIAPPSAEGSESVGDGEEAEDGEDAPDVNDLSMHRSHAMSSAMVSRLASELVRRHPDRLWVHAEGGGTYDRVTVVDLKADPITWLITMNAAGSNSAFNSGPTLLWSDAVSDEADPAEWVRQAERLCGLAAPPKPLPPSTPMSLVPRFIAIFLATQLGSQARWLPTSIKALDHQRGWHLAMASEYRRTHPGRDSEMVFLSRLGEPEAELCLTSAGELWRRDGRRMMLADEHRSGEPIVRLLLKTVPDLLP